MIQDSDGTVRDVGRRTRVVPVAIRRALDYRDRGCRFGRCDDNARRTTRQNEDQEIAASLDLPRQIVTRGENASSIEDSKISRTA